MRDCTQPVGVDLTEVKHVGIRQGAVEPAVSILFQADRRYRTVPLALLNPIESRGHVRIERCRQDRPVPERAGADLPASAGPTDDVPRVEEAGHLGNVEWASL